jgi:hypothetical protein
MPFSLAFIQARRCSQVMHWTFSLLVCAASVEAVFFLRHPHSFLICETTSALRNLAQVETQVPAG